MNSPGFIKIMIVDDHQLVRIGMTVVINRQEDMKVVAEAEDGESALEVFRRFRPDIVLMDLRLPGQDGIEATAAIISEFPQARVLVISNCDGDEDIYQAMSAGASGYLFKSIVEDELISAIREIYSGKRYVPRNVSLRLQERMANTGLTPREHEILDLLCKGLSNKELSQVLGSSPDTVKTHLKRLFRKLGVSTRSEAVREGIGRGFIHVD